MKKKNRLLHVTQPTTEGVALGIEFLCRYHNNEVFEVHVCCPNDSQFIGRLNECGVEIHAVDFIREISPLKDIKASLALARLIRNIKPDILALHSSKVGVIGRLVGRLYKVRRIVYTPNAFAYFNSEAFSAKFYYLIEKLLGPLTDKVIAVSQSEYNRAVQDRLLASTKMQVIENGIDIDRFNISINKALKRKEVGIPEESKLIGMVGRLGFQKAPEVFLAAASILFRENSSLFFYIAGDGPKMDELRNMVIRSGLQNNFLLLGNRKDVPELLHITDVFVLPSRYEGLPFTLLEAMSVGLPIVATDTVGNRDVILHNETGVLVPIDDPTSIAKAINSLLDNSLLARRLGRSASRYVMEKHSVEVMVKRTEELYLSLLG